MRIVLWAAFTIVSHARKIGFEVRMLEKFVAFAFCECSLGFELLALLVLVVLFF